MAVFKTHELWHFQFLQNNASATPTAATPCSCFLFTSSTKCLQGIKLHKHPVLVQQGIHYSYSNECSVVVLCISFRWHYPHTGWPPWLHQRVLTLTATLTCSLDDRWHTRQGSRCYTPHTRLSDMGDQEPRQPVVYLTPEGEKLPLVPPRASPSQWSQWHKLYGVLEQWREDYSRSDIRTD